MCDQFSNFVMYGKNDKHDNWEIEELIATKQ